MPLINSNYLKFSIEDLNNEILVDPTENELINPNLPLTSETIAKCWKIYRFESVNVEDAEKTTISANEYNPKTDIKEFDFKALDDTINTSDLRRDLQANIVDMQEHYFSAVNNRLLNQSTDLQIKNQISLILEEINKAITKLESLKTNKVQTSLKELLLRSYKRTLDKIQSQFSQYLPNDNKFILSVDDERLDEFIYPARLKDFKLIESRLVSNSWIKRENGLLNWDRSKTELVDFCRFLKEQDLLRGNKKVSDIIKFLQARYNTDVGSLYKPSKFNKRPLKSSNFIFLIE